MIKKNKKKTSNVKQLLSVRELKTWLDGYCSAHDAGWSPSLEQWELIRDKIFSLKVTDHDEPSGQTRSTGTGALFRIPYEGGASKPIQEQTLPPGMTTLLTQPQISSQSTLYSQTNAQSSRQTVEKSKDGNIYTSESGDPSPFI